MSCIYQFSLSKLTTKLIKLVLFIFLQNQIMTAEQTSKVINNTSEDHALLRRGYIGLR